MQVEIEKSIRRNGDAAIALLDGMMRSKLNSLTSAVTKIFPEGLVKPFRENCLSLMTLSGAKGGTVSYSPNHSWNFYSDYNSLTSLSILILYGG